MQLRCSVRPTALRYGRAANCAVRERAKSSTGRARVRYAA